MQSASNDWLYTMCTDYQSYSVLVNMGNSFILVEIIILQTVHCRDKLRKPPTKQPSIVANTLNGQECAHVRAAQQIK